MRRIIFDDPEYDVRVTVDMPEEIFDQLKADVAKEVNPTWKSQEYQRQIRERVKQLGNYTLGKAE